MRHKVSHIWPYGEFLGDNPIEEMDGKVEYLMRERRKEGASLGDEKGLGICVAKV